MSESLLASPSCVAASIEELVVPHLPGDVWNLILPQFSPSQLLRVVGCISKVFHAGVHRPSLWRRKLFEDFPEVTATDGALDSHDEACPFDWLAKYKRTYLQYYCSLKLSLAPLKDPKFRACKLTITNRSDLPLKLQPNGLKFMLALHGGHKVQWEEVTSVFLEDTLDKTVTLAPHETIDRPILFTVKPHNNHHWAIHVQPITGNTSCNAILKEPYTVARPSLPHLAWQYRFNVLYTREKLLEADVPVSLPDTFRGTTESNVLFLRDTGVSTPMKPIPSVPYTIGNPVGSRYRIVKM